MNQSDRTLEEKKEDEVLFDKTNEGIAIVARNSIALTQAIAHTIMVLNEKLLETKSENIKLKHEIINFQED